MRKTLTHILTSFILLSAPASNNYVLQDYALGNAGGGSMSTESYGIQGVLGEQGSDAIDGNTYSLNPGLRQVRQAAIPGEPTVSNESNYYNRLRITIDPSDNPADAVFAVAISSDNFVSTEYVAEDGTLASSLTLADYRTYAEWGGGTGSMIVGLDEDTTYTAKVKAMHGEFTESGYGPSGSAATVTSQLSFDIDLSTIDETTTPPYLLDLGILMPGSIITSDEKVWISLNTNADGGAFVYAYSQNAGLYSQSRDYLIETLTGNLTLQDEGFGAQALSTNQTSGGPLASESIYTNGGENIGHLPATSQTIFHTTNSPIVDGRASLQLKVKSSTVTPASNDYTEVITLVASGSF